MQMDKDSLAGPLPTSRTNNIFRSPTKLSGETIRTCLPQCLEIATRHFDNPLLHALRLALFVSGDTETQTDPGYTGSPRSIKNSILPTRFAFLNYTQIVWTRLLRYSYERHVRSTSRDLRPRRQASQAWTSPGKWYPPPLHHSRHRSSTFVTPRHAQG